MLRTPVAVCSLLLALLSCRFQAAQELVADDPPAVPFEQATLLEVRGVGFYDRDGLRLAIGSFKIDIEEIIDDQTLVATTRTYNPGEPEYYDIAVSYENGLCYMVEEGIELVGP